jgi:hypothetical protein
MRFQPVDPALMRCDTVWVPRPRDVFVFVARVGEHDANPLGRINKLEQNQSHCTQKPQPSSRRDQQGAATWHLTRQGTSTLVLL